jgi:hypothetical protein
MDRRISPQEAVTRAVLNTLKGRQPVQPRIKVFVEEKIYKKFVDAIERNYVEMYGSLIADQDALEEGFENVIYMGCAICKQETHNETREGVPGT